MGVNRKLWLPALAVAIVVIAGISVGIVVANSGSSDSSPSTASNSTQASQSPPVSGLSDDSTSSVGGVSPDVTAQTQESGADPAVEPDPNFEEGLRRAGISQRGWKTDFSLHSVSYDEILSGGVPRDGIPPLDRPKFTTQDSASRWLGDQEPVIAFELNGDIRAYPLQILTWHEIVNDVVGGVPVAVTFCPLCNTAIVFDRTVDGVVHDFGTSGKLRNSDLVMWDRQTESWWQQFTGEAIVGKLTGTKLDVLPSPLISWADFKAANPEGTVLSRDTGFNRPYGQNPYGGYDRADNPPFLFDGDVDGRLAAKDRVVDVSIGDVTVAFPFKVLERERVVNYTVNDQDIAVFFKSGTVSALDRDSIEDSRDVGATGVFESDLNGQKLTFVANGDTFVDNETGTTWNILGQAVDGPLSGEQLKPVVHTNIFWFAIAAFRPDTIIFQGTI